MLALLGLPALPKLISIHISLKLGGFDPAGEFGKLFNLLHNGLLGLIGIHIGIH